ncbi:MAG: hypothetical protein CBC55_03745 [Gammaproteobacteria bacterium TMED95]|uniref:hypothetical protein n=1 Tax=Alteromonas mediterranea TaxID=314275 RepID=UPI000B68F005|nr:hypothetical protein [Alteromonas mediterranea]OUV22634.1 MAG: hypothetical protein CBC55_03745 [Gammaproteobacteria bacterium TMED95]
MTLRNFEKKGYFERDFELGGGMFHADFQRTFVFEAFFLAQTRTEAKTRSLTKDFRALHI